MTNLMTLIILVFVGTRFLKLLFSKKARKKSIIFKINYLVKSKINRKLDKWITKEMSLVARQRQIQQSPNVIQFTKRKKA
jgi:hypothetical protein